MRARRPRSRVGLARSLVAVRRLPFTVHSFARGGEPALAGFVANCQVVCGRDARAPGWGLARSLVAVRRLPFTVSRLRGAANPLLQGSLQIARSYAGGTPALPGGVSLVPCCCKEVPVHGHSFARGGEPAIAGFVANCQVECGRDARAPGWGLARDLVAVRRLPFTVSRCEGRRTRHCRVRCKLPGRCGRDARAPGWGLARDLVAVRRFPFTVTRLRGAANPPLPRSCCRVRCKLPGRTLQVRCPIAGETPALPGGVSLVALLL